jgi:hypothetical protein
LTSAKYALGVTAAVAILAACTGGGGGSQLAPSGPSMGSNAIGGGAIHVPQLKGTKNYLTAVKSNAHGQIKHFKQWMEPGAVKNRLLYVSDFSANIVQVYNYPSQGTQNPPAGTLTGFSNPQGMCVDSANNVYIANTGGEDVLQYPYGGTSPTQTYTDTGEYPVGCSVDPTTGNLAISNIFSPTTGEGAVTICSSPSSCATYVEPGGLLECYFIGYQPNGDLYVDGIATGTYTFGMAYLPAGSTTWQTASVSGATINFPGTVQSNGTQLSVEDQSGAGGTTLYACNASGASLDCSAGTTVLSGTTDVVQSFIKRGIKGVTGADNGDKVESTWAYPAGGSGRPNKTFTINNGTYSTLIGNAVVLPPS